MVKAVAVTPAVSVHERVRDVVDVGVADTVSPSGDGECENDISYTTTEWTTLTWCFYSNSIDWSSASSIHCFHRNNV